MAYLSVDEQSTYIDVTCDGFSLRLYGTTGYGQEASQLGDLTIDGTIVNMQGPAFYDNTPTYYYLTYDQQKTIELLENTHSRVVIRIVGQFERSDTTPLGGTNGDTSAVVTYYIYPDRVIIHSKFTNNSASTITINSNNDYNWVNRFDIRNFTNENSLYENDPSESNCSDSTAYDSANYLLMTADECNLMCIPVYHTSDAAWDLFNRIDGIIGTRWNNFSWTAGLTLEDVTMWIIDSVDRENGSILYDSTDRLAMGDQYKDTTIANPSPGSQVTDLNIPDIIGDDNFASDGAWHYESDGTNYNGKQVWDTTRKRPAIVIHDWPLMSGSTPDEHLLGYWKCDDNAASSTVTDELGVSDANWEDVATQSNRNTNTPGDSVSDAVRGTALDTQNGTSFIDMVSGSGTICDNDFFKRGSISVKFKPQFGYDDGSSQFIFCVRIDGNNNINLYYNAGSDIFRFYIYWGSTLTVLDTPAYTSNNDLQQWHTALCSWDSDNDFLLFMLDGKVIATGVNTGTPSTSHPSAFHIGCDGVHADAGDIIIDEIKTFDACILPYGAYHIGNGAGLLADIDNPHSDLTFFWDCQATGAGCAKSGSGLTTSETGTVTNNGTASAVGTPILGSNYYDNIDNTSSIAFSVTEETEINLSSGSLGIWFYIDNPVTADYLFGYDNDGDLLRIYQDGANTLRVLYYLDSNTRGNVTGIPFTSSVWNFIELKWQDGSSGFFEVYLNGVFIERDTHTGSKVASGSSTMYFGAYSGGGNCDYWIGAAYITNNPNTPQIWTNFGKPLWLPLMQDNN